MTRLYHERAYLDEEGVVDDCRCGLTDPEPFYDTYDPDDHEPMGGDPYWSED